MVESQVQLKGIITTKARKGRQREYEYNITTRTAEAAADALRELTLKLQGMGEELDEQDKKPTLTEVKQ